MRFSLPSPSSLLKLPNNLGSTKNEENTQEPCVRKSGKGHLTSFIARWRTMREHRGCACDYRMLIPTRNMSTSANVSSTTSRSSLRKRRHKYKDKKTAFLYCYGHAYDSSDFVVAVRPHEPESTIRLCLCLR